MAAKNKPNELYIERLYDAPVKMVWDAWVDPEKVAKWWGPRGFTLTSKQKDVRVGGTWTYMMHGPDGVDYPNKTVFHEVEKYSKLVYDHGANDDQPAMFRVTVLFSENAGKTKMEMWMALATPEQARETAKFIKKAGGNSTWDRLAEYLAKEDTFVVTRTFEAPIDVMFDVWTDPNKFSKWLPPTGMTQTFIDVQVKPGGEGFYKMENAEGLKMYGKIQYKEIVKPNKLVYTQIFTDEKGEIARHPLAPTWPEKMLTTVRLYAETAETTRIEITWVIEGAATDVERKTFHDAKSGMTQGWGGSFEKLDAYLAGRRSS
ncbi:hypothetical protein BH10BDE1_BH10BDE1_16450 [soil metagenome]